ncbi:MAG: TPM domain-containing protein [Andreesenia angusta]|nr:TPM domain-containing protein [Andreesenia angusta]
MRQLKGKVSIILFIFTLMIFFSEYSLSMELPKKGKEYYYDEVGILSEESINEIEKINSELISKTGAEIQVVVVKNFGKYSDIREYATELFNNWGIGDKEKDNGILFLVVIDEKKTRIEVGYGLEGAITDGKAGRILDDYVIPYFKKDDYDKGIINGFRAIVKEIKAEYDLYIINEVEPNRAEDDDTPLLVKIVLYTIVIIFFTILYILWALIKKFFGCDDLDCGGDFFGGDSSGGGSSGGGGADRGW